MHAIYSFPHVVGRPGIGTTARHQVEGLARRGVSLTLVCAGVEGALDPRVEVVRTLALGPLRVPHRAIGVSRAYRIHDRLTAALIDRVARVDLVHVWPAGCVRTLRSAARRGIPTLREVPNTHTGYAYAAVAREMASLGLPPIRGHSHTASRVELEREELEYQLATSLLVPSEFSKQTFLDRGVPLDRLVMHQYGYDPDQFQAMASASGREGSHDGLRAVFVGRCEPRKGLHHALRAWIDSGAADRGRFVICGTFVEGYAAALAPLLEHPSVEVRGFVADPAALMRDSDVLLLPSVEEGSALVTYEAQACGCLPLVSDAAGARCVNEVSGLVHAAGDVDTLTRQLAELDSNPALVQRLRTGALANSAGLTWDAAAAVLERAYAETISAAAVDVHES